MLSFIKLLKLQFFGFRIRVLIGDEIGVIKVVDVVIVIVIVNGQGDIFIDFVVVSVIGVISIVVVVLEMNSFMMVYSMNRYFSIIYGLQLLLIFINFCMIREMLLVFCNVSVNGIIFIIKIIFGQWIVLYVFLVLIQ